MPDGMQPGAPYAWRGQRDELASLDPAALAGARDEAWWRLVLNLLQLAAPSGCKMVLGYRLLRLGRVVDAVVVTSRAVLVLLIVGEGRAGSRAEAEDMALDLADFHAGCRNMPVLPILVLPGGRASGVRPLPLAGASPVIETTRALLPGLVQEIMTRFPVGPDPTGWDRDGYRPVPGLMGAACALYRRHDVMALRLASTGADGLARTVRALAGAVAEARMTGTLRLILLTGAPGAGKTLCGLGLAFAPASAADGGASFLTGNPTLVHVLREALARDAAAHGMAIRAARQRMQAVIQPLPGFRDHYFTSGIPPEPVVVIDEAQRCWTSTHAVSKTQNRATRLTDSEPGHLLDIMARRSGGAVIVCLLGGGQEIHAGEGGVAAWGAALQARPEWEVFAPPGILTGDDPRQVLPAHARLRLLPELALEEPVRAIHHAQAAAWVAAVLDGRPDQAAAIASAGGAPFRITRCLQALRQAIRPRGTRRTGLLASSGARRLRAEGLGHVLDHQDEDAVARWFLDVWPDCRSSDALETVATEFSVQGLELDHAGLCWDADLLYRRGWIARQFRGNAWTALHRAEAVSNRLNAYRVLLTRARHGTVIWMPRGDARDPTRDPSGYDETAAYLEHCGAQTLDSAEPVADDPTMTGTLL